MYIAKQLVLYPKRLKSSNVEYNKCVRAMIPALFALILKDVAILNLKPFYVSVSKCKWVGGVDTFEVIADSKLWEVFANKSADIPYSCEY